MGTVLSQFPNASSVTGSIKAGNIPEPKKHENDGPEPKKYENDGPEPKKYENDGPEPQNYENDGLVGDLLQDSDLIKEILPKNVDEIFEILGQIDPELKKLQKPVMQVVEEVTPILQVTRVLGPPLASGAARCSEGSGPSCSRDCRGNQAKERNFR